MDTFKRYEFKYLLNTEQYNKLKDIIKKYMVSDQYGKSTISNLYFDTETNQLIRNSIDKPVYKEKLRLRAYGVTSSNSICFIELKKKYKKVVYKRRIALKEKDAIDYLMKNKLIINSSNIIKEIDYFKNFYFELTPKMFIAYDREAFYGKDNNDFRITFDQNIIYRTYDLDLTKGVFGKRLIQENQILLEIKVSDAIPLWLTHELCNMKLYKCSFSKYGNAYMQLGGNIYA